MNYLDDYLLLSCFEFLDAAHLCKLSMCSKRMYKLAKLSAKKRTTDVRYNSFMMLRAKEQITGLAWDTPMIQRVPIFGLERRVIVTNSGDPECNGIYCCTGFNGNGYQFTKPITTTTTTTTTTDEKRTNGGKTKKILRCIIAKRFSIETILWYLSKEVLTNDIDNDEETNNSNDTTGQQQHGDDEEISQDGKRQVFLFWCKLMTSGQSSTDLRMYPSQTSILLENGQPGWQPLQTTLNLHPPTVEILL